MALIPKIQNGGHPLHKSPGEKLAVVFCYHPLLPYKILSRLHFSQFQHRNFSPFDWTKDLLKRFDNTILFFNFLIIRMLRSKIVN